MRMKKKTRNHRLTVPTRGAGLAAAALVGVALAAPVWGQGMMGGGMGMMGGDHCPMEKRGGMGSGMHGPGPGYGGMDGGTMKGMGRGAGMGDRLSRALPDLTDAQRNEIRELRSAHRRQMLELKADALDLRDEMGALMDQARPDPGAVRAHHSRMAEVHGRMLEARLTHRNAVMDVLTEEQRETLRERRRQRYESERMGRGDGPMMRR